MELRDPVSSASHLFAAVWAAYATLIMLRLTRPDRRPAVAVFGGSMVFLYLSSGVFHGVPYTRTENPETFRFFQRVDQSAIYILIAGTNTPIIVALLTGPWRRWCLAGIWVPTAVAVTSLWLLPRSPHEALVILGLVMGWVGLLPLAHYYRAVGPRAMNWVWAGGTLYSLGAESVRVQHLSMPDPVWARGTLYSLGAVCELIEWPTALALPFRFGFHEVFHLFGVAGGLTFFLFVVRHVIPFNPPTAGANEHVPAPVPSRAVVTAGTDAGPVGPVDPSVAVLL